MYGYPKRLNTKQDYYFVKENFPKEQWQKDWQALLDSEKNWFPVKTYKKSGYGTEDETHKIVVQEPMEEGGQTYYIQMEYKADPNCKMARLGFTREEVVAALEG